MSVSSILTSVLTMQQYIRASGPCAPSSSSPPCPSAGASPLPRTAMPPPGPPLQQHPPQGAATTLAAHNYQHHRVLISRSAGREASERNGDQRDGQGRKRVLAVKIATVEPQWEEGTPVQRTRDLSAATDTCCYPSRRQTHLGRYRSLCAPSSLLPALRLSPATQATT
jgi:hypothetical protein